MEYEIQNIFNKLTIILVLKNREEFTERWLKYINSIDPFFHIIIADGSESPLNLQYFSKFKIKSRIEYFHYGEDLTISNFVSKIDKVLEKVNTKYVVLMSNDDFPIINGISAALSAMEANEDYVCAMGDCIDVSLSENFGSNLGNHVYGNLMINKSLYSNKSIEEREITERLDSFLKIYESFWHAIYRTTILQKVYKSCTKMNLDSMLTYELAANLHSLIYGKMVRLKNHTFMLHQSHPKMEAKKLPTATEYTQDTAWRKQLETVFEEFSTFTNELVALKIDYRNLFFSYLEYRSINLKSGKIVKRKESPRLVSFFKLKIGAIRYYYKVYVVSLTISKKKLGEFSIDSVDEVFKIKDFLSSEFKKLERIKVN